MLLPDICLNSAGYRGALNSNDYIAIFPITIAIRAWVFTNHDEAYIAKSFVKLGFSIASMPIASMRLAYSQEVAL